MRFLLQSEMGLSAFRYTEITDKANLVPKGDLKKPYFGGRKEGDKFKAGKTYSKWVIRGNQSG